MSVVIDGAGNDSNGESAVQDPVLFMQHLRGEVCAKQLSAAETREKVWAIVNAGGKDILQKLLQQEIQLVKEKESELVAVKKRVTSTTQKKVSLREEVKEAINRKNQEKAQCDALQEQIRGYSRAESQLEESRKHTESVVERIRGEIEEKRTKCKVDQESAEAVEKENKELEEAVEKLLARVEEEKADYDRDSSETEVSAMPLLSQLRTLATANDAKQKRLELVRREVKVLREGATLLEAQLAMYSGQFGGIDKTTDKTKEVEMMAEKQLESLRHQNEQVASEKKEAHALRAQFEKERTELRVRAAAAQRNLVEAERAKMAAGKKIRQLQGKLKAKK